MKNQKQQITEDPKPIGGGGGAGGPRPPIVPTPTFPPPTE